MSFHGIFCINNVHIVRLRASVRTALGCGFRLACRPAGFVRNA